MNYFHYDLVLEIKYDLPLGFYTSLGYTQNFDNQPTEGAGELDYLFRVGLGYSW